MIEIMLNITHLCSHVGTRLLPGRFLAANNGGHNHHGARVGQWVEGGLWENAGDDTIHVSALVIAVGAVHSPTEITLQGSMGLHRYAALYSDGDLGVGVGDLLQFYNHVTGVFYYHLTGVCMHAKTYNKVSRVSLVLARRFRFLAHACCWF